MSNTTMPTTPTIAPIDRSMPRTRIGKASPMARIAAKEKPAIRFSALVAVAKRGAVRQKKAVVAAKNRMSVAVAGRSVTALGPQQKERAAANSAAARGAAGGYQRW